MQIQVNANHHVPGGSSLASHVESVVKHVLDHYKDQVTRVEVHLSDENSHKGGEHDMRCMMEARILRSGSNCRDASRGKHECCH